MVFTLKQLKDIESSLGKLLSTQLDVRASYRLRKFAKALIAEMTSLEEARTQLVKEYSVEGKIIPEQQEELQAKYDALLTEEVDLPVVAISLAEVAKAKFGKDQMGNEILFTVVDMANVGFLIQEEEV